jgi:hypothetical protein
MMMKRLGCLFLIGLARVSPLWAAPADGDSGAVAAAVDWGSKINEAVTTLVTGATPPVLGFGWTLLFILGVYTLLSTLLQSLQRTLSYHHFVPAAVFLASVSVLFRVLIAGLMLSFYSSPIPGLAINFHQIFPSLANGLTKTVSLAELTEVFDFLKDIVSKMPPVGILEVLPGMLAVLVLALSALTSFALTLMTAMSHIIVGVLSVVGPLFIPFYVLPGHDKRFWNWLDNLISYSMMRFVAACFAMVFAHVYIALFNGLTSFTVGAWISVLTQFIIITVGAVFAAFKVPDVTTMLFGGFGGLASDIANTAQTLTTRWVTSKFGKG